MPVQRENPVGWRITDASTAGAKALGRVIRHVGSRYVFPGTPCAVQEKQRDHQPVLKQFLRIVGTDGRNRVDCISEPGLDFPEKEVFCGGIFTRLSWKTSGISAHSRRWVRPTACYLEWSCSRRLQSD